MGNRSVATKLLEKQLMREEGVKKPKKPTDFKKEQEYVTEVRLKRHQVECVCAKG